MSKPDPFRQARRGGALSCSHAGSDITLLLRQSDLERTAGDYQRFSSDAAATDGAAERQLPIEADPPDHYDYRRLIAPFFARARSADMARRIRVLVEDILGDCLARERVELVDELALPLQCRSLAILLRLPDADASEWIAWGSRSLASEHCLDDRGAALVDACIDRHLNRAAAHPADDFFSHLVRARFRGRPLSRAELRGYARPVFASGRETLISLIANSLDWLAAHPDEIERLRANPGLTPTATEEFVRYFSPLSHVSRVARHDSVVNGVRLRAGSRVSLCWAAANRDEAAFPAPDQLRLDRTPNRHLGFGRGHHLCLGADHTRLVMRSLLATFCRRVASLTVVAKEPKLEQFGDIERHAGFRRLEARLAAR